MVIRFNIPGAGLVGPETDPAPRVAAAPPAAHPAPQRPQRPPTAAAAARPGTAAPHQQLPQPRPRPVAAEPAPQTAIQREPVVDIPPPAEPPPWLEDAPTTHTFDDEPPAWYGGPDDEVESGGARRGGPPKADPADFAPEATMRFHQGEPEDIPLGSSFSPNEWASVRSGPDVRATAVEIDFGGGRALVSASWDEAGNEVLANLAADRLRFVAPGAASHPEGAALGRFALVADPGWVGRSIDDFGLPAGTTKVGNVLVDDASGEVLGEAPPVEQSRLELAQAAREAGADVLVFTTPRDWLSLRAQIYHEREQAWYDARQAWPRQAPIAVLHRPLIMVDPAAELSCAQIDWIVAAVSDQGVIGPARSGARWTEGEARAVMKWLQLERSRPENQGLDEAAWIRLEDVAIVKLVDERARPTPSATALIECLATRSAVDVQSESECVNSAPVYERPRG